MARFEFTVSEQMDGWRLDKVVIEALGHQVGRARARELFAAGAVRLAGHVVRKGAIATQGALVSVELPDAPLSEAIAESEAALDVRLERFDFIVANKPAGQPTAPLRPEERGSLASALVGHYPEMGSVGRSPLEPGLIHRLDTGTSGLVLAARTAEAFNTGLAALRAGELCKRYLLVCCIDGLGPSGTIDLPLCQHPKDSRRVMACVHPRDQHRYNPRAASTSYRIVESIGTVALVEASAPRAMRHQIRVHFAAIGHPLEGDALYGGVTDRIGRQALHAYHLSWKGNADTAGFSVDCDLPDDMRELLSRIRG